jgi:hypothetical protein
VQLHRHEREICDAGADVVVIGNGAPNFIAGFRETTGFTGAVYTDPSLAVYEAAQLQRGVRTMLSVGAAARTLGAFARGYRQGRTQGDNLQQGGVLVVGKDGSVLWHHVSTGPGDNADPREIVRALR